MFKRRTLKVGNITDQSLHFTKNTPDFFYKKAIKAFFFTARRRRSQGVGTNNSTGDEATWREASGVSYAEVQDPLEEEERARAIAGTKRGVASLAMDSVGTILPPLKNSVTNISFESTVRELRCNFPS